ncbi:MAG: hypothetical protein ACQESP_03255 [Candidatus Muiribacteriota bacterium]
MKNIKTLLIILILTILSSVNTVADPFAQIEEMVAKFESIGITDINIVYVWGDGNQTKVHVSNYEEKDIEHFYEDEGTYNITIKLVVKDGDETFEEIIEEKSFQYQEEDLDIYTIMKVPEEGDAGQNINMSAQLKNTSGFEIKDLTFQWFFDTEVDQYYEGENISKSFDIPNGPAKPEYKVKLRTYFRYRRDSDSEIWLPYENFSKRTIKINRSKKIEILETSEFLRKKNGGFATPFFIVLKDTALYNDEDFYKKTRLFYRPVIQLNNTQHNTKFVDFKKESEGKEKFNKLIYMIELDNLEYELSETADGKEYLDIKIQVSDPLGLTYKEIKVPVI